MRKGLPLRAVDWHPKGEGFATWCGGDCDATDAVARVRVLLFSVPDLRVRAELMPNEEDMGGGRIYNVEWSPDGTRIAATTHNEVTLWRATEALHVGAASYSAGLLWTANSELLFAEGNTNVGVFDARRGQKKLKRLVSLDNEEGSMRLSPDESLLLVEAGRSCAARLYEVKGLREVRRLEGKDGPCASVFAKTGRAFATAHADGRVMLWSSRARGSRCRPPARRGSSTRSVCGRAWSSRSRR